MNNWDCISLVLSKCCFKKTFFQKKRKVKKRKCKMFMYVLVKKILIIKFNAVIINKFYYTRAGDVKQMINYRRPKLKLCSKPLLYIPWLSLKNNTKLKVSINYYSEFNSTTWESENSESHLTIKTESRYNLGCWLIVEGLPGQTLHDLQGCVDYV